MVNIEETIPKKSKTHSSELVKPIIPLAWPEEDDLDASEYVDHTCHNTSRETTSGKYVIKIPRFDYGTPEVWIISVECLIVQNDTTGSPKYTKAELLQQANLVGSCTVANFTTVMVTMSELVFPNHDTCKDI